MSIETKLGGVSSNNTISQDFLYLSCTSALPCHHLKNQNCQKKTSVIHLTSLAPLPLVSHSSLKKKSLQGFSTEDSYFLYISSKKASSLYHNLRNAQEEMTHRIYTSAQHCHPYSPSAAIKFLIIEFQIPDLQFSWLSSEVISRVKIVIIPQATTESMKSLFSLGNQRELTFIFTVSKRISCLSFRRTINTNQQEQLSFLLSNNHK